MKIVATWLRHGVTARSQCLFFVTVACYSSPLRTIRYREVAHDDVLHSDRKPASIMIGASHYRLGGDRLAAGAGRFVADVSVDGMLHAAVLRSSHAHARLLSVDAKRVLALSGVRLVLTSADVPDAAVIPNRIGAPPGTERYLQPAIARGVVRYVGEPIALVVADDPYIAQDALRLIDVVYDSLPVCASVTDAMAPGAPT